MTNISLVESDWSSVVNISIIGDMKGSKIKLTDLSYWNFQYNSC